MGGGLPDRLGKAQSLGQPVALRPEGRLRVDEVGKIELVRNGFEPGEIREARRRESHVSRRPPPQKRSVGQQVKAGIDQGAQCPVPPISPSWRPTLAPTSSRRSQEGATFFGGDLGKRVGQVPCKTRGMGHTNANAMDTMTSGRPFPDHLFYLSPPNAGILPRSRRFAGFVGSNSMLGPLRVARSIEASWSSPRRRPDHRTLDVRLGRRAGAPREAAAGRARRHRHRRPPERSATRVQRRQPIVERSGTGGFRPPTGRAVPAGAAPVESIRAPNAGSTADV